MSVLSLTFLAFVGVSSILSFVTPKNIKKYLVFLLNIVFIFLLKPSKVDMLYMVLLLGYTYFIGLVVQKRKLGIVTLVLPLVLGLCFFKYGSNFTSWNRAMPLGISFFTFKAISYIVDSSKGKVSNNNIVDVMDYIYFFPTFLAGPINRSSSFFEEINNPRDFEYLDRKNGCIQAGLGLFEKLVIADYLSYLVGIFLDAQYSGWVTVLGMIVYTFQIYVDFDAYSNIAIGVARMLGFHLERNFYTPYLSSTLKEFWRRWHISLSSWLKDYIYIPLGGNRKGKLRQYLNTLVVFLVSGIWHGSTMMFVYWGLGHGLISVIEDIILKPIKLKKPLSYISKCFGIIINFILVMCMWVFFRSSSMAEVVMTFKNMLASFGTNIFIDYGSLGLTINEWNWMFVLLVIVIVSDVLRYKYDMVDKLSKQHIVVRWSFYVLLMLVAIVFGVYGPGYNPQDFIYVTF